MSVSKGNKGNQQQPQNTSLGDALGRAGVNQQQGGAQAQAQHSAAENHQAQQRPQGRRAIMDVNMNLRRPMSRNSSGEQVIKFQDAFRKCLIDNVGQNFEDHFRLLVLDQNTNNVPLSALMVCYHTRSGAQDHVVVFTLIIEATNRLTNRHVNINGQNVEIETVAGDIYNDLLWERVQHVATESYGRQNMAVYDAGCMVLPQELDAEDPLHIRHVLFSATQACFTVMENQLGGKEEPFNVQFVGNQDQLVARLNYNPPQAENATGLPIRSDINITLEGATAGQANTYFDQVRELTSVDAYVDLVYTPPQQQQPQMGMGYQQQPMQSQHYTPRVVLTRVDTDIDAVTMELNLLALSTSTLVSRQMAWAGVFRPRHAQRGIDLHDIGAIGYEVPMTQDGELKKIDTKAESFTPQSLYQLLGMFVHERPVISMDIEEVGELSWIHTAFIAAANGNQEANQLIIDAANNLTLNNFGKIYSGAPIAQDDQNRIHLGYYIDESGNKRDLRDIDYLAMLNLVGKDDPALVVDWEATFNQVDVPLEVRLEKRLNLLKGAIGGAIHLKGYARRITYNPEFLEALNQACAAAGLLIRPNNMLQDFGGQVQRGNPNIAQWALNPGHTQGLFNYGQPGVGSQGRVFGTPFTGRFGR